MSKKKLLPSLRLALLGGLMTMGVCSASAALSEIRFVVDPTFPPFESKLANGKLIGFDIDLGNALCAEMKVKCTWMESNFDSMVPGLKARKFDAVLSDMGITEERLKQIDFTQPLYNTPVQLVGHKGAGLLPTAESLKGKRIGMEQGSIQERYAKAKWQPYGIDVISYENQSLVESDLVAGRIDAVFTDGAQASLGFLKTPEGQSFELMGPPVQDPIIGPGTAIGIRKGDTELKEGLDHAFDALVANGKFKKIMEKYFITDISVPRQ